MNNIILKDQYGDYYIIPEKRISEFFRTLKRRKNFNLVLSKKKYK